MQYGVSFAALISRLFSTVETSWELGSGCLDSQMLEATVLLVSVVVSAPRVSKLGCADEASRMREHMMLSHLFSLIHVSLILLE